MWVWLDPSYILYRRAAEAMFGDLNLSITHGSNIMHGQSVYDVVVVVVSSSRVFSSAADMAKQPAGRTNDLNRQVKLSIQRRAVQQ